MKGKILVVDDEESLVRLITYNLNKEGFSTVHLYEGSQVLETVQKEEPDLLILDLMLPGQDGLEICREIRASRNNIPIIMLTAKDEEIDKVLGLELGADDYVTKPFSVRELLARVKAVLRRKNLVHDNEEHNKKDLVVGIFTVKPERYQIYKQEQLLDLTLKEYELLEMLLRNKGRVLKRDYLLEVLWDFPESANTRVLDVHVSKLREKIEEDSKNPKFLKTVRGLGYKFEEEENV